MGKVYNYDATTAVLDINTPLTEDSDLTGICKEAEEDASVTERAIFIATAHALVVERLDGYSVGEGLLKIVETYLSAHFACITYPQAVFESVGKLQNSFSMKIALGFDQTRFGQQAKKIDPTNQLKKADKSKVVNFSVSWLGMTDDEKIDFRERQAVDVL